MTATATMSQVTVNFLPVAEPDPFEAVGFEDCRVDVAADREEHDFCRQRGILLPLAVSWYTER